MSLTRNIKIWAKDIGFDLVGITKAKTLPNAKQSYLEWINRGYAADMDYMTRDIDRRTNPQKVLPGAKSIICLALNYYSPDSKLIKGKHFGKVAHYARGKDYHKIVEKMNKLLVHRIMEEMGEDVKLKQYVDHGPILERAYAEQAGIGFIGKNGNLITKEFGSWVFLSEILTDLKLEYDNPIERGCFLCKRCIKACPTKAIEEPGLVNANKCIAYLTIENRGEIPAGLSEKLENRVFGCDACQEICPYNNRAILTRISELKPESGVGEYLLLEEVQKIKDEDEYKEKFAGTPIQRAHFKGLRRNTKIIVNNKGKY